PDPQLGRLGPGRVRVGDEHGAVVLDVDLRPGRLLDALDVLAAGADQGADLLRVDLYGQEPRGEVADLAPRLEDRLEHLPQDVLAGLLGLLERPANDLR